MPNQIHGDPCPDCGGTDFICSECGDWTLLSDATPPPEVKLRMAREAGGNIKTEPGYYYRGQFYSDHTGGGVPAAGVYAWTIDGPPPPPRETL